MFQVEGTVVAKVLWQEVIVGGVEGVGGGDRPGNEKEREVWVVPLKDSEFDFK